jgi:hypothetical protein
MSGEIFDQYFSKDSLYENIIENAESIVTSLENVKHLSSDIDSDQVYIILSKAL